MISVMKKFISYSILLLSMAFASCDEGRIPAKVPVLDADGRAAKITAKLSGLDSWPSAYTIAVAAFTESSDYAAYVKDLTAIGDETGQYTIYNIPDGVKTLEICATNSLRRRIATFASMDISKIADTITFDAGTVNVGMFQAIQNNIFTNKCASCHGSSSGTPSANLHLNAGMSYTNLVNKASTVVEGTRIIPGDADNSVLYRVLTTNLSDDWHCPLHSNFMSTDDDIPNVTLLRDWINNGAKE